MDLDDIKEKAKKRLNDLEKNNLSLSKLVKDRDGKRKASFNIDDSFNYLLETNVAIIKNTENSIKLITDTTAESNKRIDVFLSNLNIKINKIESKYEEAITKASNKLVTQNNKLIDNHNNSLEAVKKHIKNSADVQIKEIKEQTDKFTIDASEKISRFTKKIEDNIYKVSDIVNLAHDDFSILKMMKTKMGLLYFFFVISMLVSTLLVTLPYIYNDMVGIYTSDRSSLNLLKIIFIVASGTFFPLIFVFLSYLSFEELDTEYYQLKKVWVHSPKIFSFFAYFVYIIFVINYFSK